MTTTAVVPQIDAFNILIRAHDLLWNDKTWPLAIRMAATQILWDKAIAVALQNCDAY